MSLVNGGRTISWPRLGDKIIDAAACRTSAVASTSPILPVELTQFYSVQLGITCGFACRLSSALSLPILHVARRRSSLLQQRTICGVVGVQLLDDLGDQFPHAWFHLHS